MSDKGFLGFIAVLIIGTLGFIVFKQESKPPEPALGQSHKEQSREHIASGAKHEAYTTSPATSGPHYADSTSPAPWGVYVQEVPEEVFVHNLEHGGVVITYSPDLPADQIKKLQDLFVPPYSDKSFKPNKAMVTPRTKNTKAIQVVAWNQSLNLNQYDEAKLKKFYLQRVGKAPEAAAGPNNVPINQAAAQPQPQVQSEPQAETQPVGPAPAQ